MRSPIPLCDTNVISELARPAPDPGVLAWASTISLIGFSVVSLEEIYVGLSWRPNPRIVDWFDRFVAGHCEVLPVTEEVARVAGQMRGLLQARGEVRLKPICSSLPRRASTIAPS
jgi:toxin FitB